jgi:peptidoglycan-N-acetylglucosamine deacetylase
MRSMLWFLLLSVPSQFANARTLDVAITIDSLPGGARNLAAIEHALSDYNVGVVTGFVQGNRVNTPERALALKTWYAGGHRLGSNTYAYANATQMSANDFIAEVSRNEDVLHRATGESHSWRLFRFPFLEEGADADTRSSLRQHLRDADYRIVPVTVDPGDRHWDAAYTRCMKRGDTSMAVTIQRGMVADTLLQLLWADEAARFIFGRPIKHILTVHAGSLLAANAAELLQALTEHRVRFIDLDTALQDPAYATIPENATPVGGNLLAQIIAARDLQDAPRPMAHPINWLAEQCLPTEAQ